ncbi:MAG: hypothetical protein G3M70_07345 [Candidatus Nitronauta litoralis]|uniref:Uncharacterized protein n=1 Tax=Candidatus Nitronauta litoralis TaxID=2705533 RepID=A0A7T0FZY5_9BACT|nr:MAG: hypothetical protein G3M70_07345 [Candidatus Nitronauta litoralis]
MTINYKGDAVRAISTLGLGGVDITKWPITDAEVAALKSNIGYALALTSGLSALGQLSLVDGIVNPFSTESEIDLGASSNQVYNATSDLYAPKKSVFPGTEVTSNPIDTDSGTWADYTMRILVPASQISADGTFIKVRFEASATEGLKIDNASIVERSSGADGVGVPTELLFSAASGFDIAAGAQIESDALEFSLDSTKDYLICVDVSNDTAKDLSRGNAGGNLSRYYKAATNSYNTQTLAGATFNSGTSSFVNRITVGLSENMIVQSNAITANAVPTEAHLSFVLIAPGAVPDTDIKGYVSRDGGTTFTQVPLSSQAVGFPWNVVHFGGVDISGQPSGSSMKWKFESANNTDLNFENVTLLWN